MEITMLGRLAGVGEAVAGLIARRFSREFTENVSNLFNKPKRR
jgi:hypothetical protein